MITIAERTARNRWRGEEKKAWLLRCVPIVGCIALGACSSGAGEEPSAKSSAAAVFEGTPPPSTPWLVVLCKVADYPQVPVDRSFYTKLLATPGTGGLFDYWHDQSYGHVDLTGTVVTDWTTTADTSQIGSDGQRWINNGVTGDQRVTDCINTQTKNYDVNKFYNVMAIWNVAVGAQGGLNETIGGKNFPNAVKMDVGSTPSGFAHEMGHGYGLNHSYGDVLANCGAGGPDGQYCDGFDIMGGGGSYIGTGTTCVPNVTCYTGPGLSFWNRYELGWSKNVVTTPAWPATYSQTFTMAPRNHPEIDQTLGLIVPAHQDSSYTVEFISNDGWESGIAKPYLAVHRVYNQAGNTNRTPYQLFDQGGWQGDFTHPFDDGSVRISLLGMSGSPPLATVRVSYSTNYAQQWQKWTGAFTGGCGGNLVGDVDGDGKADIVGLGCGFIGVELSNGSTFGPYQTWYDQTFQGQNGTFLADVTGDGKADLVALNANSVTVLPSTGSGFGWPNPPQTWSSGGFNGQFGNFLADVTGDGKADLVGLGNGFIGVLPSTGSSFGPYQTWYDATFSGQNGTLIGDVTGDGKADLVALNNGSVTVLPSSPQGRGVAGTSFGWPNPPVKWLNNTFNGSEGNWLADVTGDGKADLVGMSANAIGVVPSGGYYTDGAGDPSIIGGYETWSTNSKFVNFMSPSIGDVTGDGRPDLVVFAGTEVDVLPPIRAPQ
jgi:M6 family metalloprotease-like protein